MAVLFILLLLVTARVYSSSSEAPRLVKEITSPGSNDRPQEIKAIQDIANAASGLPGLIYEHMQNVSSPQCANHMKILFATYQRIQFEDHRSRIQFEGYSVDINVSQGQLAIDACGKPVPEILRGNIHFSGGYDECMKEIDTSAHPFKMQYVEMPLSFVFYGSVMNDTFPYPTTENFCLPENCTTDDINRTLQAINELIKSGAIPLKVLIWPSGEMSIRATWRDINVKYSAGAIVMIFISFLFVAMAGIGSAYDLCYYYTRRNKTSCLSVNNETDDSDQPLLDGIIKKESRYEAFFTELLLSFSLYKTVPALLSTNQPPSAITSINGMRVISMFWIIMYHSYSEYFKTFKNTIDVCTSFTKQFPAQPILNGSFSIDSFFFLSGLLVAYLTFREMERKKGRFPVIAFYVHRIARLTPVYMYMLFFYTYVAVHIPDGPNLHTELGTKSGHYKNCTHNWWSNLLYINNFYPKYEESCMGWTWYLANDMQYYVISPLFILPLFYFFPVGISSLVVCLVTSISVTGFIAGYYGYDAIDVVATSCKPLDPNLPNPMDQIYVKPYCRIMPYLVGLFLGFLLYKKHRVSIPSSYIASVAIYAVIWMVAIVLGMVSVYGLHPSFNDRTPTPAGNVMYFMFSNFSWGVALALVVYACHNGFGGVMNRFLSLHFWIPLGRLTYTAYLVHEVVLLLLLSEMRDSLYFSGMIFTVHIIANVALSFGGAVVISLLVEFPISNVERAIFKFFGNPLRASSKIPVKN